MIPLAYVVYTPIDPTQPKTYLSRKIKPFHGWTPNLAEAEQFTYEHACSLAQALVCLTDPTEGRLTIQRVIKLEEGDTHD